jgi:hypothetical protein
MAGALVAAIAGTSFAGCTGDGGDQVVVSDDGTADGVVAAAASTLEGSGRFRVRLDADAFGSVVEEGEFSGRDHAATVEWHYDEGQLLYPGDAPEPIEMRSIGQTVYRRPVEGDEPWRRFSSEELAASSMMTFEELAGALRSADGVRESGTEDVDGQSVLVYEVDISVPKLLELMGATTPDPGLTSSDPERARRLTQRVIDNYHWKVTVAVDGEGRLRRLVIDLDGELPSDLRNCAPFDSPLASKMDVRLEFTTSDLGADITIAAPDPLDILEATDGGRSDPEDDLEDEIDERTVDTSDGPVPRIEVEYLLEEAAEEELPDLDPDTVADLSDADAVARYEELKTVRGGDVYAFERVDEEWETEGVNAEPVGPTLSTSDGDWERGELESWVADDADRLGIDEAAIPSMTDEQLVAAYERTLVLEAQDRIAEEFEGCPA